jgi:excisionase family DNA binding protein
MSNVLTVTEAARRAGCDPETIRRWIRQGRLQVRSNGRQHGIEEQDLEAALHAAEEMLPVPARWQRSAGGQLLPNVVAAVSQSRHGH